MTRDEREQLLIEGEQQMNSGEHVRAMELCHRVLSELDAMQHLEEEMDLLHRSWALRLLSESYARRRRGTEALPIAEQALEVAQKSKSNVEEAKAIANLGFVYEKLSDYTRALEYCNTALVLFQEAGDRRSEARVLITIGVINLELGIYNKALDAYNRALELYSELGYAQGVLSVVHNLGTIYIQIGDHKRALEYFNQSLEGYREAGNRAGVGSAYCNIGAVHVEEEEYSEGLEYLKKALVIFEELDMLGFIANVVNNIGAIHLRVGEYDAALECYKRVLAIREQTGDKHGATDQIINIGELHGIKNYAGYDPVKAEEYLLNGLAQSIELGVTHTISNNHHIIATFYKSEQRWKEFAEHFEKFHDIQTQILNDETRRAAEMTEQRRLTAERDSALAIERARAQATEELLYRTLPQSIAERIILGESRIADYVESASILFADVVGFTQLASALPPSTVLDFMNFIFEHFDAIAAKHGCERIKTIGDGYMAVCGVPITTADHSLRIAQMAREMMEDIALPQDIRQHLPPDARFHLRIGLHCGEIIAGLIGTGKLAYDIYGDAVNLAARMESNGEPGRIHCSSDFVEHVQHHDASLVFNERGQIDIKGKGRVRTFFLEKS